MNCGLWIAEKFAEGGEVTLSVCVAIFRILKKIFNKTKKIFRILKIFFFS